MNAENALRGIKIVGDGERWSIKRFRSNEMRSGFSAQQNVKTIF